MVAVGCRIMLAALLLAVVIVQVHSSSVGPVFHVSFDNHVFHDSTGHVSDNSFTLNNPTATWWNADVPAALSSTITTDSFYGNGVFADIPSDNFWFADSPVGWTVSFWAKMIVEDWNQWAVTSLVSVVRGPGESPANDPLLMLGTRQMGNGGYTSMCSIVRDNNGLYQQDTDDHQYNYPQGSHPIYTNVWHHYTLTWDPATGNTKAYMDGSKILDFTQGFGSNTLPQRMAGRYTRIGNVNFLIDELLVFDRVLTDTEILTLPDGIYPVSAQAVGDPQFSGFLGQSYQVHGIPNSVYNVLSSPSIQLNSRFVFMSRGRNLKSVLRRLASQNSSLALPVTASWTHPGNYLGESALKLRVNQEEYRVFVRPGKYENGFAVVSVNEKALKVGDRLELNADCLITFLNSHQLSIRTPSLLFTLTNADKFINIEQAQYIPSAASAQTALQGLLGWSTVERTEKVPEVESYLVGSEQLFGDDFPQNLYTTA
jgi:hypothetical protein